MADIDIDIGGLSDDEFQEYFELIISMKNYSEAKETWKEMPTWEFGLKIGIAAFIMLVSLVGNGLVLIVLLKKRSLRNATNMFIINLAIADILVTISTVWIDLIDELTYPWILGPFLCKYNPLIEGAAFIASVLTMMAISLERFFGIVTPFMFCSYKIEKMLLGVIIIWVTAFSVAIPSAVFTKLYSRTWADHEEVWCDTRWPSDMDHSIPNYTRKLYHVVAFLILYAVPMIVMTAAYTAIIQKLRAKNSEITELNNNLQKNKHSSRKRVIVMLILLLTVFTICWLPLQMLNLYYHFNLHAKYATKGLWVHNFAFTVKFLADANSAFNPVIFICFSQKIRKAISGLLLKSNPVWKRSTHPLSRANSLRSSSKRTWV